MSEPDNDAGEAAMAALFLMLVITAFAIYAVMHSLAVGVVRGMSGGMSDEFTWTLAQWAFHLPLLGFLVGWGLFLFSSRKKTALITFTLMAVVGGLPLLIRLAWCDGRACT